MKLIVYTTMMAALTAALITSLQQEMNNMLIAMYTVMMGLTAITMWKKPTLKLNNLMLVLFTPPTIILAVGLTQLSVVWGNTTIMALTMTTWLLPHHTPKPEIKIDWQRKGKYLWEAHYENALIKLQTKSTLIDSVNEMQPFKLTNYHEMKLAEIYMVTELERNLKITRKPDMTIHVTYDATTVHMFGEEVDYYKETKINEVILESIRDYNKYDKLSDET